MSAPLDRGSTVPLCAVCIEAGRATEATHQTRDGLCGCDQHIQQLEQHGRAAVRRQRRAQPHGYMDRGAQRAKRMATDWLTRASKALGAGLGTVVLAPATTAMVVVKLTAAN
jgi:hypothetical protein